MFGAEFDEIEDFGEALVFGGVVVSEESVVLGEIAVPKR